MKKIQRMPGVIFIVFMCLISFPDFIWAEIKKIKTFKWINKFSIPTLLGILSLAIIITACSVIAWAYDHHFETKEIIVSVVMAIISIVIIISLFARDKNDWRGDWFCRTDQ